MHQFNLNIHHIYMTYIYIIDLIECRVDTQSHLPHWFLFWSNCFSMSVSTLTKPHLLNGKWSLNVPGRVDIPGEWKLQTLAENCQQFGGALPPIVRTWGHLNLLLSTRISTLPALSPNKKWQYLGTPRTKKGHDLHLNIVNLAATQAAYKLAPYRTFCAHHGSGVKMFEVRRKRMELDILPSAS